jgi:hypothetical protein
MKGFLLGLAIVAGVYVACVVLFFVYLIAGLAVADGASGATAESAMIGVILAAGATFLCGGGVVYRGLGRAGAGRGARVLVTLLYLGVALATALGLAFASAVAFNR